MDQARGHGLRTHLEAPGKVRQFVVAGWIEGLFRDRCPDLIGGHEERRRKLIGFLFFLLRAGAGSKEETAHSPGYPPHAPAGT